MNSRQLKQIYRRHVSAERSELLASLIGAVILAILFFEVAMFAGMFY